MMNASLESNRRSAYRVRPTQSDQLTVALRRNEERHVADEISDVTINGAAVCFAGTKGPALSPGDRVSLEVESPELSGPANVLARIISLQETPRNQLLHLLFEEKEDLVGRGSQQLFRLFNQRAAFRGVEPEADDEFNAKILPIAGAYESSVSFSVELRNISTTGACLSVDKLADGYLRERSQFQLSFTLPNRSSEHTITARICYRAGEGEQVYYGCRFEWDPTPDSLGMIEDLAEYMLDQFEAEMPPAPQYPG